ETYGPGLGDADNIRRLLDDPQLGLDTIISRFLPACRTSVEIAHRRDPCAGFIFTDPFDGVRVRWNPVRTAPYAVTSGRTKITVNIPITQEQRRVGTG